MENQIVPRSPTIIASIVCACFVSAYCESVESYENGDSGEFVDSVESRFEKPTDEIPDFQRHVAPLLGRLGCNGRACHGSFQGRGGFRLSLFGYDFESDHRALLDGGQRVDVDRPRESLILTKPTDADAHDGGLHYERDSWQYNLLKNWIQSGAEPAPADQHLIQLNVVPNEVLVNSDQTRELKVIAHWSDGFKEDVTPLCRFQTNDPQIASVTPQGRVSSSSPGDTHVVVLYDNAVAAIPVIHPLKTSSVADYPTPTRIDRRLLDHHHHGLLRHLD